MRIGQFPKTIWQAIKYRPEHCGQAVVEPFGQKIDAAHLADAHVGADVEETMRVQRLGEEFQMRVSEPHVAKGEGDEGNVGLAVVQIQFERNSWLEVLGSDAIVQKDCLLP